MVSCMSTFIKRLGFHIGKQQLVDDLFYYMYILVYLILRQTEMKKLYETLY